MKLKLLNLFYILPIVGTSSALVVDSFIQTEENTNLSKIFNKDNLLNNIYKDIYWLSGYDDGLGPSLYQLISSGIENNFTNINLDDLNIEIYYGDQINNKNLIDFEDPNNVELIIFWFTVEISPKNNNYTNSSILTFDFRPSLNKITNFYYDAKYSDLETISRFTSAVDAMVNTDQVLNNFNNQLIEMGFSKDETNLLNYKNIWITTTDDKVIENSGVYDPQSTVINHVATFNYGILDVLDIKRKSQLFKITTPIKMKKFGIIAVKSSDFKKGENKLEYKKILEDTSIISPKDKISSIDIYIKNNIRDFFKNQFKIDILDFEFGYKYHWKSEYDFLDYDSIIEESFNTSKNDDENIYYYTPWIEIIKIFDMRVDAKEQPGYFAQVTKEIKND